MDPGIQHASGARGGALAPGLREVGEGVCAMYSYFGQECSKGLAAARTCMHTRRLFTMCGRAQRA